MAISFVHLKKKKIIVRHELWKSHKSLVETPVDTEPPKHPKLNISEEGGKIQTRFVNMLSEK